MSITNVLPHPTPPYLARATHAHAHAHAYTETETETETEEETHAEAHGMVFEQSHQLLKSHQCLHSHIEPPRCLNTFI